MYFKICFHVKLFSANLSRTSNKFKTMSMKRGLEDFDDDVREKKRFLETLEKGQKKHTLDSDESDDDENEP